MPHGTPDWGLVGPKKTVFGLDDLAEHAVRMGSPHLWDRRGDVILTDTFEHGLGQCEQRGNGANWAIRLEGGYAWQGGFCAKLITGDEAGDYGGIRYRHGVPVDSRLGIEFSFSLSEYTRYIYWRILRNGAGVLDTASVWYDFQNNRLWVDPDTGPDVAFATDVNLSEGVWHTGKLVADFGVTPRLYTRFLLNNREWPLGAHDIQIAPGLPQRETWWDVTHYANADDGVVAYVDNVILTQNEP